MSAIERDATIKRLPEANPQAPECGSCGGTTEVYNRGARCRASDVRATEGPS